MNQLVCQAVRTSQRDSLDSAMANIGAQHQPGRLLLFWSVVVLSFFFFFFFSPAYPSGMVADCWLFRRCLPGRAWQRSVCFYIAEELVNRYGGHLTPETFAGTDIGKEVGRFVALYANVAFGPVDLDPCLVHCPP